MKKLAILILWTLGSEVSSGQLVNGYFAGVVTRDGSAQKVSFQIMQNEKVLKARYTIEELGYCDVRADTSFIKGDTLNIKFYYGNFYCFYNAGEGVITGISQNWNPKIRLYLKRTATPQPAYSERKFTFDNAGLQLAGTVIKPLTDLPIPYVVLIHGSDYQDRNTPYYRSLACNLARNGIGAVIYDKRGCGESGGNFETASFEDLAGDAIAAMDFIRTNSEFHCKKIGFLGTSQGGWIAPIAANRSKSCSFLILNVGPAVSVFDQEKHRIEYNMRDDGFAQPVIDSAKEYIDRYFTYALSKQGTDWKSLTALGVVATTRPWSQYVSIPKDSVEEFRWWLNNNYDPSLELSKIKCPVLSLMGEKDNLVPPAENLEKMEHYLGAAGVPHIVKVIPGAAHDMLTYQGLSGGDKWNWPHAYWRWRNRPAEFMDEIVQFITN